MGFGEGARGKVVFDQFYYIAYRDTQYNMKKHHGMRPQDIVVLLKIALQTDHSWYIKDLATALFLSQSELSESLHRSVFADLLAQDKKTLMRANLLDFLVYGLRFVFPQKPTFQTRGIPTAHSAFPLREHILSEINFVWPYAEGWASGLAIEPLYPTVPQASLQDAELYELLALVDALRVGRKREQNLATEFLTQKLGYAALVP